MFGRFSRMLVVDDGATMRTIVHKALNRLGYDNIDEAAHGRMALAMLAQHPYRLVLSDWNMAPVNGIELLQTMRADVRWARTPFIMMTVQSQKKFVEVTRDSGTTLFLPKPFTDDMLAAAITRVAGAKVA